MASCCVRFLYLLRGSDLPPFFTSDSFTGRSHSR
jgi:hypothetical protein